MRNETTNKSMRLIARAALLLLTLSLGIPALADTPYRANGTQVDKATYTGWKLYKRQRCETCHGPTAEGGAAFPNLLNSLKNLTKDEFIEVVLNGRKNMPPFKAQAAVVEGLDGLYGYLKGRSDGAIPAGDLEEMQQP